MRRPEFSHHLAAAMLSAWGGAAAVYGSLVTWGVASAAGSGLHVAEALQAGTSYGFIVLAVSVIPFAAGSTILGPIAYIVLSRLNRTGAVGVVAGALLSGCIATLLFISIEGLQPLILVTSIGGAAAAWTYRRALLAMGAMPPSSPSNEI